MFAKSIRPGDTLRFGDAGEVRIEVRSWRHGVLEVYGTFEGLDGRPIASGTQIKVGELGTITPRLVPTRGRRIMVGIDIPKEVRVSALSKEGNLSG